MRRVLRTMGTVASVRIDGVEDVGTSASERALDAVQDAFDALEDEFSRYRPDSPASRIADGRLSLLHASDEHRSMYAEAVGWRNETGGAFDPHRADGSIDLSGIVKAVAIERAGTVLESAGLRDWCVNVGGDVLVAGRAGDRDWTVGVSDPADPQRILRTVTLSGGRRAAATSGTSERGEHVWRTDPEARFRQVTVVADDIVTADVLSTAVLAGGPATRALAEHRWGVTVFAVTRGGTTASGAGQTYE